MTENLFATQSPSLTTPLIHIFDVTPGQPLPYVTRAIMLEDEGKVEIVTLGGETVTTLTLAPGVWHPIMATQILNCTASAIQGGC